MANISELLKKIKSARYGRDVRDSIHDAIQAMNTDIKNNVPTVQSLTERAEGASSSAKTYSTDASAAATNAKEYSDSAKRYSESAASAIAMAYDTEATANKHLANTVESPMLVTKATRNLLNPNLQTTTQNGVTCTNNGDGTYTLNGTASDRAIFAVCGENFYALSHFVGDAKIIKQIFSEQSIPGSDGNYENGYYFAMQGKDKISNIYIDEIVVDDYVNKTYRPIINVSKGVTVNNVTIKPMLTTDLNATYDDFVPYSGYDIKTCGKNLLIPYLQTTTLNGITCTNNGDGTYTFNGTATNSVFFDINKNISINKGTKYNVVCFKDEDYIPNKIMCGVRRGDITIDYVLNNGSFVSDTENCWLWIKIGKDVTVSNLVAKPTITTDLNATYDNFIQYQDGGTVHIDSSTELPLLGLKSFNGITNIISPGNVEVSHALTDTGKYVMQNMKDISDIKAAIVASGSTTE